MKRFEFNKPTLIKNFLTDKALTILRAINNTPNSFSKDIMIMIAESGIKCKKSQFYRYIDSLQKYNLIKVKSWIKDNNSSGYLYQITEDGTSLLKILSKLFE